jgi:hypothetical protein
MLQTANTIKAGTPYSVNETVEKRSIPESEKGLTAGTHIDRLSSYRNPIYGSVPAAGDTKLGDASVPAAKGQHGWHYKDVAGSPQHQDGHLKDEPKLPGRGADASQIFETTALALEGPQEGTYYGSVRWGWRTDGTGAFTQLPLSVISAGNPTADFQRSAALWNAGKTSTGDETMDLPVNTNASILADPTTVATAELAIRIGRIDADIAKATGTQKTQLEFEKKAMEAELARRGDAPTTSYAAQETAAAAKSTEDIIKRVKELESEIPALAAGATKTDRVIEKSALEAEMRKRVVKVTVKVHETEDWLGADNVVITIGGNGGSHRTGEKKLNNGQTGDFLIPLAFLLGAGPPAAPFEVRVYDVDWPDGDDLMFEKLWSAPFAAMTDTQSRDDGRYEVTVKFDK